MGAIAWRVPHERARRLDSLDAGQDPPYATRFGFLLGLCLHWTVRFW